MNDLIRLTTDTAAIKVDGLTVGFPRSRTPVVCDVSLSVRSGEVLGIVGESGCGKTTLGLALLGYTRPGLAILAGSVTVGETNLIGLASRKLQQLRGLEVSYVPQDPASALNPALRIGLQLRETLEAHPEAIRPGENVRDRVSEVLAEVGLPVERTLKSYPHQMSGGQQQRVAIAMAIVCRPGLIVMDEPTTGLDVSTQRQILATIRKLIAEYNCAVIYVSHDLPVVAEIADRVAVMYAGRVVEEGPSAQILVDPSHPYAAGLLRAAPSVDQATLLVGIEGSPPRPGSWPRGCAFADRCSRVTDACLEALPSLVPNGDGLVRCVHPVPPRTQGDTPVEVLVVPSTSDQAPMLSVNSVAARYGTTTILRDVSFDIGPGRTLAVVGESGSGKTTLARCISGLHRDWSGSIAYVGDELAHAPRKRTRKQRESIQYVFQNAYSALNPKKTVGEILEAPLLEFHDLKRQQRHDLIGDVLADVALNDSFIDRYPFQLSGGERQRVAIGRALILDPDVLICDEVTSALDVSVQADIVEQLRKVQVQRGVSLLFITHNLAVVRSVAHDVVVLSKGKIVERGTVESVLNNPSDEYTVGLLRDVPRLGDARGAQTTATSSRGA